MLRNRRITVYVPILIFIILSISVWVVLNMNSNTNSLRFNTVDNLDQVADLIIVGTPTETFENREHIITNYDDGSIQDFYTLTEITIDEISKKPEDFSESQETISIIEPVSLDGDTKLTSDGYVEL